jgi:hypothetical protein
LIALLGAGENPHDPLEVEFSIRWAKRERDD